ncbi:hypothetical protein DQG23_07125 [Paenibacillus contaminans]|uniref:Helix-hairpin-helix DNA-binding motif class 1 domain-containing protein n=2 Tax=Paenibacillus contaminans TaxID=450362 RepID=A0A329MT10_9BACL|nr:hypothetical protein DQG23_07125 [Paenibacillus contaminans]
MSGIEGGTGMISAKVKWLVIGLIGILAGAGVFFARMSDEDSVAVGMQRANGQLEAVLKLQEPVSSPAKTPETQAAAPPGAAGGSEPKEKRPVDETEGNVPDVMQGGANSEEDASRQNETADIPAGGAPEASSSPTSSKGAPNGSRQIDLNSATIQQLVKLPGIGESKAKAIIAYREQTGGFRTAKEITKVKGIGDKTYEALKDLIAVSSP